MGHPPSCSFRMTSCVSCTNPLARPKVVAPASLALASARPPALLLRAASGRQAATASAAKGAPRVLSSSAAFCSTLICWRTRVAVRRVAAVATSAPACEFPGPAACWPANSRDRPAPRAQGDGRPQASTLYAVFHSSGQQQRLESPGIFDGEGSTRFPDPRPSYGAKRPTTDRSTACRCIARFPKTPSISR
jgi:hypothetical protein